MQRLYIDANIYIDFFEWREDRWRHLGEIALSVFNRILEGEFELIISKHLVHEVKKRVDSQKVDDFLDKFRNKELLVEVQQTPQDLSQAKKISNHFQDPLHVILAKKGGADYFLTRDVHGFPPPCPSMVQILVPESLP